jgi:hypothetical protein
VEYLTLTISDHEDAIVCFYKTSVIMLYCGINSIMLLMNRIIQ